MVTSSDVSTVSIVIPTLNEEQSIGETLRRVQELKGQPEIIVADGGSSDRTTTIAGDFGVKVLTAERGRGMQLRAGAAQASGDVLWFLHADTHPPRDAISHIVSAIHDSNAVGGNFRLRFTGNGWGTWFTSAYQPILRSCQVMYGDSAIFARRDVYEKCGGMGDLPLFEDLDLVRRLKKFGRVITVPAIVTTSSRRFEGRSFSRTFAQWTLLQVLYWVGVSPKRLARMYKDIR
jgi:rSAM/selenodomain-associated transferase 2